MTWDAMHGPRAKREVSIYVFVGDLSIDLKEPLNLVPQIQLSRVLRLEGVVLGYPGGFREVFCEMDSNFGSYRKTGS